MSLSDVIQRLNADGLAVRPWHIRHAILAQHVTRPAQNGSGRFDFLPAHLDELRSYFAAKRRPGPRSAPAHA
jgi:hypothetical protein